MGGLTLALALFISNPASLGAQDSDSSPSLAPLFTLNDINGNQVSLEDYRGKVVMINFWATWCPPCVEEMPTMQALKQSLSDQPFEILAINMGETESAIKFFIEQLGIDFNFPLLMDTDIKVANQYQVSGLPATLLVDKQGVYAFGGIGPRDWQSDQVMKEILPLIEE